MGSVDCTSDNDSDILIIGSGIFGTSTAYHLSQQSQNHASPSRRITVLDRAPTPSPAAASSDINKIVRADYSKPFYMDLAYEAMRYWTSDTDSPLGPLISRHFHQTGWVALDEEDSDLSARIRKNFRDSGRPDTSADISLDEVKTKWGGVLAGIDTTGYDKAYTNSSAGWADACAAVEAMMTEATKAGGVRYEVGEVVELVVCEKGESESESNREGGGDGDGHQDKLKLTGVRTADGRTFTSPKILLATGAWTPWLMSPMEQKMNIPPQDSIQRQMQAAGVCVAAFRLSEDEARHYSQMPVLIYGSKGEVMPPQPSSSTTDTSTSTKEQQRFFKFTNSNTFLNTKLHPDTGQKISVPEPDQKAIPEMLAMESIEVIRQRVPEILSNGRTPDDWRLCWDAVSPDQNQLITQHPDPRLSNLYFATAGSFHSWKFLPNIGRYVANVLDGKSNGMEQDEAWAWKTTWQGRGAHEKVLPKRELGSLSKS
jgi:sarcosine oxidase/L-pipecolate oxidase